MVIRILTICKPFSELNFDSMFAPEFHYLSNKNPRGALTHAGIFITYYL